MNNNNDNNLTIEKENKLQKEEINSPNKNDSINNSKSNNNPVLFNQVTRSDLLLFKEDFLKSIREVKNEINKKIKEKFDGCNKLIEESNNRLYNFETDKNNFIQKLNFLEEKHEILSKISKTTVDIKNDLNTHMTYIQNCQKDLSNLRFKYDNFILNNLMIAGFIGPMCKFDNLKEYILNNNEQISYLNSLTKSLSDDFKITKKKLDELKDSYESFKKGINPSYQIILDSKMDQLKNKMEKEFELYSQKITDVKIYNMAYAKSFIEKEQNLDVYLNKMEEIKKAIYEDNLKIFERTKSLNSFTLSKLEKNINESINVKKCVLELSNIFTKQKRTYGDNNLNENKREVIMNFSNMVNNLIKDLINSKNKAIQQYYLENQNLKSHNTKEPLDLNSTRRNTIRTLSRKLTENKKNLNSNSKSLFNNILNDNKESTFNKRKTLTDNQIKFFNRNSNSKNLTNKTSKGINTNEYMINNENNIITHENNILVNENNKNENKFNINNMKNIENSININIKGTINNYNLNKENDNLNDKKNNKNIDIKNYLYKNNLNNFEILGETKKEKINNFIDINSLPITKKKSFKIQQNLQHEITNLIKENIENETINSIEEELQTDTFNSTKNNLNNNKINSLKISLQREKTTLSNTDRIISRNSKIKNFIISDFKSDNSNEKIVLLNTDRKSNNSKEKEKILSLLKESHYPQLSFTSNIQNKNAKILPESSSGQKNLFQKGYQGKDILENKIKNRPVSKNEKNNKGIITKDINEFASISYKPKNNRIDYDTNRKKEYNKELYYDKNIETNIKDKDIIDKPLLSNHYIFEVLKGRSGLEKKILELEYFTKKKFDELVKEIKYFIPIHFNSHIKDYTIVEIDNKNRNRK